MVNPTFNFSGLASGLDTTSIISQLVQLERQPIVRYQQQQRELRAVDSAWGQVVSKLSGVRSAVDDIRRQGSLSELMTATSSDESAVSVEATGGGSPDSLTFTVTQLASRHREGFDGQFSDASAAVGAGTLTLTDQTGATLGSITTDGTTTLQGLADQIDALDVGVNATVLKVADGDFRLIMTSDETGADAQFGVSTDLASLGTGSMLAQGLNAQLTLGALTVERSSNTFTDVVEGATITVNAVTTGDVTIDLARDTGGVADTAEQVVTAMNELIDTLDSLTAYNAETNTAGRLQGEPLARNLAFNLRAALTQQVYTTGDVRSAGDVGIGIDREGKVTFDRAEFEQALAADPDAVFNLLSESLTGTAGAEVSFAGDDAVAGDFTMNVSQAASVAAVTGATFVPPVSSPETFTITTSDGTEVTVTIDVGMGSAEAVARINAALEAAEVSSLRASEDGGALRIGSVGYGSEQTFSVAGSAQGLDGSFSGTDVVADFGAGAVTGTGRSINGAEGANDLVMKIAGGIGTYNLSFGRGLGGLLDDYLASLEGQNGLVQVARDSIDSSIDRFDDQIAAQEIRVEQREVSLRRQFAGLETTLGRLQSQGSFLASQLAGLPRASSG